MCRGTRKCRGTWKCWTWLTNLCVLAHCSVIFDRTMFLLGNIATNVKSKLSLFTRVFIHYGPFLYVNQNWFLMIRHKLHPFLSYSCQIQNHFDHESYLNWFLLTRLSLNEKCRNAVRYDDCIMNVVRDSDMLWTVSISVTACQWWTISAFSWRCGTGTEHLEMTSWVAWASVSRYVHIPSFNNLSFFSLCLVIYQPWFFAVLKSWNHTIT